MLGDSYKKGFLTVHIRFAGRHITALQRYISNWVSFNITAIRIWISCAGHMSCLQIFERVKHHSEQEKTIVELIHKLFRLANIF